MVISGRFVPIAEDKLAGGEQRESLLAGQGPMASHLSIPASSINTY